MQTPGPQDLAGSLRVRPRDLQPKMHKCFMNDMFQDCWGAMVWFCFFNYFWLLWVFDTLRGFLWLQRAGAARHCLHRPPIMVASVLEELRLQAPKLSSAGSVVVEHQGSVASWHVESSPTRDGTCVPCTGRQMPRHCATRKAPEQHLVKITHQVISYDVEGTGMGM